MLIPILYVFYCIQYSLLSIRLYRYGFYKDHTDAPSLMFSSTFISRIAFPLAFNFMWMFNFTDSDVTSVIGDFSFDDYLCKLQIFNNSLVQIYDPWLAIIDDNC